MALIYSASELASFAADLHNKVPEPLLQKLVTMSRSQQVTVYLELVRLLKNSEAQRRAIAQA